MKSGRFILPLLAAVFLTSFAFTATGNAASDIPVPSLSQLGGLTIPAAWQGIWHETITVKDCTTHSVINTTTVDDTLCASAAYNQTFDCSGTINDNNFDITCTADILVFEGCTAHVVIHTVGTRTGSSYTSTTTANTTYVGCIPPLPPSCTESDLTGTKTSNATVECSAPVEPMTWGGIKTRYLK